MDDCETVSGRWCGYCGGYERVEGCMSMWWLWLPGSLTDCVTEWVTVGGGGVWW